MTTIRVGKVSLYDEFAFVPLWRQRRATEKYLMHPMRRYTTAPVNIAKVDWVTWECVVTNKIEVTRFMEVDEEAQVVTKFPNMETVHAICMRDQSAATLLTAIPEGAEPKGYEKQACAVEMAKIHKRCMDLLCMMRIYARVAHRLPEWGTLLEHHVYMFSEPLPPYTYGAASVSVQSILERYYGPWNEERPGMNY